MDLIKKAKHAYITISVIMLVLGLVLLIWPKMSLSVLCCLIGVMLVIGGAVKLVGYFSKDLYRLAFQFDLALGIFVSVIGIILILHPYWIMSFFPIVIGIFIMVDGVFKIQTSVDAQRFGLTNWWLILTGGILCIVLGILLVFDPFSSATALVAIMGVSLIVDGLQNLFNVLYTVKIIKRAKNFESEAND